MDTTRELVLGLIASSYSPTWCDPAGTQRCGVPIRLSGGLNDGLRETEILNRQLESTETCMSHLLTPFSRLMPL